MIHGNRRIRSLFARYVPTAPPALAAILLAACSHAPERATPPPGLGTGERDHLRLDVEDQGEGMSPATIERVFEPFFTTKPPGEGTGLGLAVAQEIARGHGGWITARSRMGQGSCFSMYLPEEEAR